MMRSDSRITIVKFDTNTSNQDAFKKQKRLKFHVVVRMCCPNPKQWN